MKKWQRWILIVGLAFFGLSGLFPSWIIVSTDTEGHNYVRAAGRSLILSPPKANSPFDGRYSRRFTADVTRLDFQRLLAEWVLVGVLTAGLIILTKGASGSAVVSAKNQHRVPIIVGGVGCAGWFLFALITSEGFSRMHGVDDWGVLFIGMVVAYLVPYSIARIVAWRKARNQSRRDTSAQPSSR